MFRIISWNINSLRARMEHLSALNQEYRPDVICLQETKVRNSQFPIEEVKSLGLKHILYDGIPSYNGVAVLSHQPIEALDIPRLGGDKARHLPFYLPKQDIRVDNLYVPAGGDTPDLASPKFADKMQFMAGLSDMAATLPNRAILLGDLNIAPGEFDVWSHRQMLKIVSHTPVEVDAFNDLLQQGNLQNILRHSLPEPQKIHSWWSYRVKQWQKDSRGLLLDHALLTPALMETNPSAFVAASVRGWQPKPSDHAPLVIDLHSL